MDEAEKLDNAIVDVMHAVLRLRQLAAVHPDLFTKRVREGLVSIDHQLDTLVAALESGAAIPLIDRGSAAEPEFSTAGVRCENRVTIAWASPDDVITAITSSPARAASIMETVRARKMLEKLADLLYIEPDGMSNKSLRQAIITEALS